MSKKGNNQKASFSVKDENGEWVDWKESVLRLCRQEARYTAEMQQYLNERGFDSFEIVDNEGWEKGVNANKGHFYGLGVYIYASIWASMMESRMAQGEELEAIAKQTSHEADEEMCRRITGGGMSGASYGFACEVLAHVWKHGERFRRWHNLGTQIGNEGERANEEGGVLNPAFLTIDPKA